MANASTESRLDRIEQLLAQEAEAIRQLRQTQVEESERIRLAQEQESQRIHHIREQDRDEFAAKMEAFRLNLQTYQQTREQDRAEFFARLEAYNQARTQEFEQIRQTQLEDRANFQAAMSELRQAQAEERRLISDLRTQQALMDERVAGLVASVEDMHEALLEFGQVITEAVEELRASHRRQDRILDYLMGQHPPQEEEP